MVFKLKNSGQHINRFRYKDITYNKHDTLLSLRQIGINAKGLNEEFSFMGNQFSINDACAPDVRVEALKPGQHVGAPEQGEYCDPAGKCFTKQDRLEIETDGPNYPFTYHILVIDESNICYLPTNNLSDGGVNNYYLGNQNGTIYENECDGSNIKGNGNIESTGNSSAMYSESIADSVEYNWDNGNYNKVKDIFRNMGTTFEKRKLYGVHLTLGALDSAQIVLNSIPLNTIDDQYFRDVQLLNIQRLQENKWPVYWNASERELLNSIASTDQYSASYAGGLLALGESNGDVEIDKIHCISNMPPPAERKKVKAFDVNIYPNPAYDRLNLEINTGDYEIKSWTISGIHGKVEIRGIQVQNNTIAIEELPSGVYILQLKMTDGRHSTHKFIKL